MTIFRQGEDLYEKNVHGQMAELAAESPVLFDPNGPSTARLTFERGAEGRVMALVLHDDRHEERWERRTAAASR